MKKYVCVLSTNNYLDGVLLLNENLKSLDSKYELLCIVNEEITEETLSYLKFFNIEYKIMNKIDYKCEDKRFTWKYTFDKLNIFNLTEYEKIVYIDTDMLITENIDHLFDYPAFTAASNEPFIKDELSKFNSGVLVVEPDIEDYNNLIYIAKLFDKNELNNIGDQDVLNFYFKRANILPKEYNVMRHVDGGQLKKYYDILIQRYIDKYPIEMYDTYVDKPKIIHYISHPKPFNVTKPYDDEYYYLYKEYLDRIRIKKHIYQTTKSKITTFIMYLNKNNNIENCLLSLKNQTYQNIEIVLITYNKYKKELETILKKNKINNYIIITQNIDIKEIVNTITKEMDYANIITPDMEFYSKTYETAITRSIDFDLEWLQFRRPNIYSLPYFQYIYEEKDFIYYKTKDIITNDFTDKIFKKEFFIKYASIDEIINNSKRVGIIGFNCYKKNNQ